MIQQIDAEKAAEVLKHGGVIAYPTEAVWGLGCDPFNRDAVRRLIAIKQRPFEKGVLVVADNLDRVNPWLRLLPSDQRTKIEQTWPGPVTWVVPNHDILPTEVTGGRETIAIRVSAHAGVQALCRSFGNVIVSTSANLSGEPAITSEHFVRQQFADVVDYIVPGQLGRQTSPSAIYDAASGKRLR